MIHLDTIMARCDGLLWRNYDGEVLIMRENTLEVYMLNKVASHIWEIIDARTTIGDIIESVCHHFEVEREIAESDVFKFVIDLINRNLIKIA